MTKFRTFALALVASPLTLGVAACDTAESGNEITSAEPIAPIEAPEGSAWTDVVTMSPDGGFVLGNPDAPIKLVEYGSLTCGACAAFAATGAAPLKEDYVSSGRVSFEFRSMVLRGPADLTLSRLIGCGQPEAAHPLSDQVWGNLDAIFDTMQANGAALEQALQLPEDQRFVAFAEQAGFLDFFAARGLSKDQARQCLADFSSMEALAEQSQEISTRDNVTATPTFFLNGRRVETGVGGPWAAIEPMLKQAGAR
ncbi:DsbA family protein [Pontixanthobacter gangjinensis]|uniref:Thioredoxin domain-containing protein n=1 Tax=Pontixanthobacter gangjinensis TaxID=1028742 RepID=A0A6I4SM93_9SPHN|nr:thioredoxin domain-containing protein [Pontixanthobacter gangjinensis]MXO56558.1 thioredoxin domain-containing protein [Pontixanthobacter gangjinensis]